VLQQPLPDVRALRPRLHARASEHDGVADARTFEQLGALDRPGGEDHLASCPDGEPFSAAPGHDADGPTPLDDGVDPTLALPSVG
jgi:hypothetical protein